ncbi:MAG: methyltransferase type 11 [Xanthomonadaceae bacterium]|nr:methyltransferase type 11 [Xanthomonadaceae bacterium]
MLYWERGNRLRCQTGRYAWSVNTVEPYNSNAERFAASYESLQSEAVHGALREFVLPGTDRTALDIGAGSGRDAAWLASMGYTVVAVEPSAAMRREAQTRHADSAIHWLDDRLPGLARVHERGIAYDLILLSAVWMHVPPDERERAFRKIVTLLKPGGVVLMSLREGPAEADRPMWPAPLGEVEGLARNHGLVVLKSAASTDQMGRTGVTWTSVALRLPDDGSGALPTLRGIILKDDKSSTYKLGLLRAIAKVADAMPSLARPLPDEDAVKIPLGAVALAWVRMYLPLVAKRLPQTPRNQGPDGLGFAKEGFRALLNGQFLSQDLRIGAQFSAETGHSVILALSEASELITRMPAHHITYPASSQPIFIAQRQKLPSRSDGRVIDRTLLEQFGSLTIPGPVWRSLMQLGSWIEPVLIAEWSRLVKVYAGPQSSIELGHVTDALAWIEHDRDTRFARSTVERIRTAGVPVRCVWTGADLRKSEVDIDHCLPWSAWPCNDLWNLMPSSESVNRNQKRERLPSQARLSTARTNIQSWWERAWLDDPVLRQQFEREAEAALPIASADTLEHVFDGLEWRRLRLRTEQQVTEWM